MRKCIRLLCTIIRIKEFDSKTRKSLRVRKCFIAQVVENVYFYSRSKHILNFLIKFNIVKKLTNINNSSDQALTACFSLLHLIL